MHIGGDIGRMTSRHLGSLDAAIIFKLGTLQISAGSFVVISFVLHVVHESEGLDELFIHFK